MKRFVFTFLSLLFCSMLTCKAQVINSINSEQDFVNYLYWLEHQSVQVQENNLSDFYHSLPTDTVRSRWYLMAADYLQNADSPVKNDSLFQRFVISPFGEMADSLAAALLQMPVDGLQKDKHCTGVLFFYDPDCEHCKEAIQSESAHATIQGKVYAVCITDNEQAYLASRSALPKAWYSMRVTTDVLSSPFFGIAALPWLYYFK